MRTNPSGWEEPDWEVVFDRKALDHVLDGTVENGVASGFHHATSGTDHGFALVTTRYDVLANGVYPATVSIQGVVRDSTGRKRSKWFPKPVNSMMFPDPWTGGQVRIAGMGAAKHAFKTGRIDDQGGWDGYVTGWYKGQPHIYHVAGILEVSGARIIRAKTFFPHNDQRPPSVDELEVGW